MPITPFHTTHRDLAFDEMRCMLIAEDSNLPAGRYGLLEHFCTDRRCDCRRVILLVLRADTGDVTWATIGFGWEDEAFCRRWSRDPATARLMSGAFLDPLNPQSEFASELLRVTCALVLSDADYVARLAGHYRLHRQRPARRRPVRK